LARQVNWKVSFVAQYSPRPGTAAWRIYPDDVDPAVKKHRWEVLDALINKNQLHERPEIK
jgi:tRNA A37 methylthiotransferase MiaB